ncbi:hypothetical protein Lal_00036613 [Lupinus albus]|nr:hypothetical protein Lal_00036613 [Lupinus albus]
MAQPCIHISMFFVVLLLFLTSVLSRSITNHTIDLDKLSRIREQLEKINKPGVKTIKSQDGDIIDCVLFHEQPAFDLPELKDQKTTLQLPEWPEGYNINENTTTGFESFQLWSDSGNMPRFGQKVLNNSQHEYAIVNVKQDKFYGAKTSINVWAPKVSQAGEFSLAQIWLASGSFEAKDLNTIEVGWQVFPDNYGGDKNPRLFGYWTRDAYETTGCHNLDPKNGNWWLSFGSGILIGYWPASLLPRLKSHADILQFGGEIVNCNRNGHTTTQMGSGHFAEEGFKKAAFFRDINLVNSANKVTSIPARNLLTPRNHPNCYNTKVSSGKGKGKVYDTHFFFGGPGKNPNCS